MSPHPLRIILGCGGIGDSSDPIAGHTSPAAAQTLLNIFRRHGYTELDTARAYPPHAPGSSEPMMARTDCASWGTLETKVTSTFAGSHSAANVAKSIDESLKALNVDSVEVMYLHWPDRTVPLVETVRAMGQAHTEGKFREFGLSNYEPGEVEDVIAICEKYGCVKPTVYQVQYNAVNRSAEDELLAVLRKHGIRAYAWSPAAAGFFGKKNRFKIQGRLGDNLREQYEKPGYNTALEQIHQVAGKYGITGHGIALRWVLHHSKLQGETGDGIVIGARTDEQLEETLKICEEGPLPKEILDLVERCWEDMKHEAPHFSPFKGKWEKRWDEYEVD